MGGPMPYAPVPVVLQASIAAPTGTASTTPVMLGLGDSSVLAVFTPQVIGRILVIVSGQFSNTNGNGTSVRLSYGTGTPPVNGAALTGTQVGLASTWTSLTGALKGNFCIQFVIAGLSVPIPGIPGLLNPTTYWLDLAFNAVTAGTGTCSNVSITAIEL